MPLRIRTPAVAAPSAPPTSSIVWVKIAGVWKQAVVWIRDNGVWKQATPYIRVSGMWK